MTWRVTKRRGVPDGSYEGRSARRVEELKLGLVLPRTFPAYANVTDEMIIRQCWNEPLPWEEFNDDPIPRPATFV